MLAPPPLHVEIVRTGFAWDVFWIAVQAIGSLFALGIAISIPRWQDQRDRQRFRETVLAYAQLISEAVVALATYSGDFTQVALKLPLQQAGVELKLPMILSCALALPLDRLHSPAAASTFLKLIGSAQTYRDEMVAGTTETNPDLLINGFTTRRFAADRVVSLIGELREQLSSGK